MNRSKRYARPDGGRCVACGACVKECPRAAIRVDRGRRALVDEALCVGCGRCARICPADCIALEAREVDG